MSIENVLNMKSLLKSIAFNLLFILASGLFVFISWNYVLLKIFQLNQIDYNTALQLYLVIRIAIYCFIPSLRESATSNEE